MDIGNKTNSMDIKVYAADTQSNKEVQSASEKAAKIVSGVVKERSIQDKRSSDAKVIDFTSKAADRSRDGTAPVEAHGEVSDISTLASEVKSQLKSLNTEVRVAVDGDSGNIVFKIIDSETNDLIKQIPSEEMLEISRRLSELLDDYSSMKEDRKKVISVFKDTMPDIV